MDEREMVSVKEAREMLSDDARAAVWAGCDVLSNTPAHAYGEAAEVSRAKDLLCDVERLARTVIALRAEHAAALDAARREGAEGMRAAAVAMIGRRITAWDDDADECGDEDAATRWEEATAIRDAIRALPLDAPGGGS